MKKVLVTGASGQLGSEIRLLTEGDTRFHFTGSNELDISDMYDVQQAILSQYYDVIINCAAYTAVDKAESDSDKAFLVNETGAKNLAEVAMKTNAKLIHISTDFIFDGTQRRPILEDDIPHPLNIYGKSKLAGERAVLKAAPNSLIFRTSWVYSSFGNNFVKTILRLCSERDTLSIIDDQVGTPTYARDLAQMILDTTATAIARDISGVFNYSNEGKASWYDFAVEIRTLTGLTAKIIPIETKQYPTPAERPKYSILDKEKIKRTFGIQIPNWRDSLIACMNLINQNNAR
jgi:dTDP-4-dehydrorhamnose reductase